MTKSAGGGSLRKPCRFCRDTCQPTGRAGTWNSIRKHARGRQPWVLPPGKDKPEAAVERFVQILAPIRSWYSSCSCLATKWMGSHIPLEGKPIFLALVRLSSARSTSAAGPNRSSSRRRKIRLWGSPASMKAKISYCNLAPDMVLPNEQPHQSHEHPADTSITGNLKPVGKVPVSYRPP